MAVKDWGTDMRHWVNLGVWANVVYLFVHLVGVGVSAVFGVYLAILVPFGLGAVYHSFQIRSWIRMRASVITVLVFTLLGLSCGGDPPATTKDFFAKSPKGVTVRSYAPIDASDLARIDAQIDQLIVRARANGLTDTRSHNAVSIQILPRAAQCYDAGFLLGYKVSPGTNYDGSVWDMDPTPGIVSMCVSGRYLETTDLIQVTLDGLRSSNIVRYEGEHWLLFHSDRAWYERSKIHNADNLHPILGD